MTSNYKFDTREQLDTAVDLWLDDEASAIETYGDINTWDVSEIDDFSNLFSTTRNKLSSTFNSDISNWDVAKGENFLGMFFKAQIRDSILAIVPDYQFELKDYDNKIIKVNLWKVKDNNSDTGWDKEYGIININESNELLRVQYFNWEILFKPLSYFKKDFTK